jgi:hypothetical protein
LEKTFEEYVPPKNTFDLVSAQFSIPFVSEKDFGRVWTNLVYSLKEGGIFTGQFFGLEDDWSENSSMTFHSDKQVRDLLAAFEIVVFREEKFVEKKERSKFWHFYEIIARKKHV